MSHRKYFLSLLLIFVIFVSGCISVEVEQKIKRNGKYDMEIEISTSAEYKTILSSIRDSLEVDDSVKDKFEYRETDTSVIYSFKDIDPEKDKKLFKKVDSDSGALDDMDTNTDYSMFDPESTDFKKELKFPYYEYTYTFNVNPNDDGGSPSGEKLLAEDYILDDVGLLDYESEEQIMEFINNIYENDSIEVLIVTEDDVARSDYFSYRIDLINEFDFKNSANYYVIIFTSIEDGYCTVDSNLYYDTDFTSKINSLNREFSDNCQNNYPSQIKYITSELNDFSESNEIQTMSDSAEQIGNFFKIGYTVEVFGEIVETNGLEMEENKVKFDVNPAKEEEYKIVFRDFFLVSILGDMYWVYLIVLFVVIAVFLFYKNYPKIMKKRRESLRAPLPVNPQLIEYVRRARSSGMTDQEIMINLTNSGWQKKDIDMALRSY